MYLDSTLIIDFLETVSAEDSSLMPQDHADRMKALQITGTSLVAMEKVVALIYECRKRPKELQYLPWIERVDQQLRGALDQLEASIGDGSEWIVGAELTQADITLAVAWRFVQHVEHKRIQATDFPGLMAFSERAEALPEFIACPVG